MKICEEIKKELKVDEKSGNFHISIDAGKKAVGNSLRELMDGFDLFLAKKGVRSDKLDMENAKIIFKKPDEVRKAMKVLDKSPFKGMYIASDY